MSTGPRETCQKQTETRIWQAKPTKIPQNQAQARLPLGSISFIFRIEITKIELQTRVSINKGPSNYSSLHHCPVHHTLHSQSSVMYSTGFIRLHSTSKSFQNQEHDESQKYVLHTKEKQNVYPLRNAVCRGERENQMAKIP